MTCVCVAMVSSCASVERQQVLRYGIEIVVVEMHCRHQRAGFEVCGVVDEGAQILCIIRDRAGRDGVAAGKMGQVRAKGTVRCRAGDGVAVDASVVLQTQRGPAPR